MAGKTKVDRMTARCILLEGMGFECNHQDSSVGMGGYDFDFSSVPIDDAESVLRHVIRTVKAAATAEGERGAVNRMRAALHLDALQDD